LGIRRVSDPAMMQAEQQVRRRGVHERGEQNKSRHHPAAGLPRVQHLLDRAAHGDRCGAGQSKVFSASGTPLMNRTASCSMLPMIPLAFRLRKAWRRRDGMATIIPVAVATRASDMPAARTLGSPLPKLEISLNVAIMPMTVPSNPMSGPA